MRTAGMVVNAIIAAFGFFGAFAVSLSAERGYGVIGWAIFGPFAFYGLLSAIAFHRMRTPGAGGGKGLLAVSSLLMIGVAVVFSGSWGFALLPVGYAVLNILFAAWGGVKR